MRVRVLGKVFIPTTDNSTYEVTYVRDEQGGHIIVATAGGCQRTMIELPHCIDAGSTV